MTWTTENIHRHVDVWVMGNVKKEKTAQMQITQVVYKQSAKLLHQASSLTLSHHPKYLAS